MSPLNNLAYLYQSQGRYSEAEPLYGRSLAIVRGNLKQVRSFKLAFDMGDG